VPRIARDLGVFIRVDEALPVLRALLDAWKEDLTYRVSRVKARMKFMVDDYGAEGMRAEVERRLGYALSDYELEPPGPITDHLGVHDEHDAERVYVGAPVHVGLVSGEQLIALADLAEHMGGDVRVTRQQNVAVTGVPRARLDETLQRLAAIGFPLELESARGSSIACTGEPHCNFSVTETKTRLDDLIQHLEARFGTAIAGLRLNLDGCPHACAQHWVGDLGFQGTTARDDEGRRRQAYDIFLRGGLGPDAAIAKPVFRRVPAEELATAVEGLIGGWLDGRVAAETFRQFTDRLSNDELGALAGLEPARGREEKEAA
jgi:ferredoxin-nitrite reductase